MDTDKILHIKEVLWRIREADTDFRVFGSDCHRYSLGSPLAESELLAFEQKHGITLPADFRLFLKEVGDGAEWRTDRNRRIAVNAGAGPDYGVLPLEETVYGCNPSSPFPLVPLPRSSEDPWIQAPEEWNEEGYIYPGLLWISYSGCAFFNDLVVNGSGYGTVWRCDDTMEHVYFYPTGLTFGEWYRRWLDRLVDRALSILAHEELAKQVTEGMSVEDVVRICGGEWQQRQFTDDWRHMQCDLFATQFEIDQNDRVRRIIRHSIYV